MTTVPLEFRLEDGWDDETILDLLRGRAKVRLAGRQDGHVLIGRRMSDEDWRDLHKAYRAPNERIRTFNELAEMLEEDCFHLRAARRTDDGRPVVEIRARGKRGLLYGGFELIEKLRRAEDLSNLDQTELPDLPVRYNEEFLTVSQKLSRQANLRRIEDFFRHEAFYLRFNGICPVVSNARALLPVGYPDYAERRCVESEYYRELALIHQHASRAGLDFYYPTNLIPLPPEFEPLINSQVPQNLACLRYDDPQEGARYLRDRFPGLFTADGRLDVSNPVFENMLRAEIAEALRRFPDMKGVHIYACEAGGHNVVIGRSYGGLTLAVEPERDLRRMLRCIRHALPDDKKILMFTHMPVGVGDIVGDVLDKHFPDIVQLSEVQTGPQYPGKVIFGALGRDEKQRKERLARQVTIPWILFDAEHTGSRSLAFCFPQHMHGVVRETTELGALGVAPRTSRDYGVVMGTLLAGGAYAGMRTAWSLDSDPEALCREWVADEYGPGAEDLAEVLLQHETLFRKGVLVNGVSLYDLVGGEEREDTVLGSLYQGSLRYPHVLELFAPEGTVMAEAVHRTRDRLVVEELGNKAAAPEAVLVAKEEAAALAGELAEKVRAFGDHLPPEAYAYLLEVHENLARLMALNRDFSTALSLEARFRRDPKQFAKLAPAYEAALDALEDAAYQVRCDKGEGFFYGYPKGLMNYVQIARQRLGALRVEQEGA